MLANPLIFILILGASPKTKKCVAFLSPGLILLQHDLIQFRILYHAYEGLAVVDLDLIAFHVVIPYRCLIDVAVLRAVNVSAPRPYRKHSLGTILDDPARMTVKREIILLIELCPFIILKNDILVLWFLFNIYKK